MTRQRSLARRYALALAELARERGQLDEVEQALGRVSRELESSEPLREAWMGTGLTPSERVQRLRQHFGDGVPDLVYSFLGVVASKGRQTLLSAILEAFSEEADRMRQIERVEVETAAPLGPQEQAMLQEQLAKLLGARAVRLSIRINPELIGGLVVRAGDRRIDFSLSRQLQELYHRLRVAPLDGTLSVDGKAG